MEWGIKLVPKGVVRLGERKGNSILPNRLENLTGLWKGLLGRPKNQNSTRIARKVGPRKKVLLKGVI